MATLTSSNFNDEPHPTAEEMSARPPCALAGIGSELLVPTLVGAQAATRPCRTAVHARDGELSYAELDQRANELARRLRTLRVGPEVIVGVYFTRCTAMVVNMLAVLKAGGAYLPLHPNLPPERLTFMLKDSGAAVVLSEVQLVDTLPRGPWRTVVEEQWPTDGNEHATALVANITPDDLAYLIYTSGSTGRPKGVEVTHSNLAHLVSWHNQAFAVTAEDRASQLANIGFDAAVWEIWPYLAAGATLCLSHGRHMEAPEDIRDWLVSKQITVTFVPTPMAEQLLQLQWPAATRLRVMLVGGDTLHVYPPPGLPFTVSNNYGPTECTVVASSGLVPPHEKATDLPPIGWPVRHAQIYLLNEQLQQVPAGERGELYIGGTGVARGYRNRPELTADRFIDGPIEPGTRLYKTGDLGRYLPDGQIAFSGRIDDQVKIRGYRIEPDEIAAVLNSHPGIKASAVAVREDVPGDKHLIAYIVTKPGQHLTRSEVQAFLAAQVPDYMVPPTFVVLDALPQTFNGKLDRAALPGPSEQNVLTEETFASPTSFLQQQLCNVVCTLLNISQVGLDDNFFLLGGHSLLGTQLIARIRDAFDVNVPLRSLFDHPTVRELAAGVEELLVAKVQNMTEEEAKQALADVPNTSCAAIESREPEEAA